METKCICGGEIVNNQTFPEAADVGPRTYHALYYNLRLSFNRFLKTDPQATVCLKCGTFNPQSNKKCSCGGRIYSIEDFPQATDYDVKAWHMLCCESFRKIESQENRHEFRICEYCGTLYYKSTGQPVVDENQLALNFQT